MQRVEQPSKHPMQIFHCLDLTVTQRREGTLVKELPKLGSDSSHGWLTTRVLEHYVDT